MKDLILTSFNLSEVEFEQMAKKVHNEWWNEKIRQGFHFPINCPYAKPKPAIGKEESKELAFTLHCNKCHKDMRPYEELPEYVKEYDRVTAKSVLNFLKDKQKDLPKEIIQEELINGYEHFLTVGTLKEILYQSNLPNGAKVLIQRVEDNYYQNHNWRVYYKEGDQTFKDENGNTIPETLEQYHPAFCAVKYSDEDNLFFINLHY